MRPAVAVKFLPSESIAWVEPGATVLEAARSAGVTVVAPCGGRGICGSCAVRVVDGELAAPDEDEMRGLARAPRGVRLACRAKVLGPVTVHPVVSSTRLRAAVPGASQREVVVGVDLGTTNVAALAVEADGGREVGRASVGNRQQAWGSDVLSRVSAALSGGAVDLAAAATRSIEEAVVGATGTDTPVARVVVAGNSVMAGLVSSVDVRATATTPYPAPVVPDALPSLAYSIAVLAGAEVRLVPPIVSFVGGDVLAGAVHTGVLYASEPAMLVDIGTNAEILLAAKGRLWATSAAAGPAFEGAGIECGGPAVPGAVTAVRIDGDGSVAMEVIRGEAPVWLSGAGLLSAVAELLRAGHIDRDGLIGSEGPLATRIRAGEDGVIRISLSDEPGCLTVSQLDLRSIQLAKAAVRVGIESVLRAAGLQPADLTELHIAGAFGGAIATDDLVELGIVPAATAEVVRYSGNASLLGATAMALEPAVLDAAIQLVEGVEHVELAADAGFASALMEAVALEPY